MTATCSSKELHLMAYLSLILNVGQIDLLLMYKGSLRLYNTFNAGSINRGEGNSLSMFEPRLSIAQFIHPYIHAHTYIETYGLSVLKWHPVLALLV